MKHLFIAMKMHRFHLILYYQLYFLMVKPSR